MASFLDYLIPTGANLSPDQQNYADSSGLLNAAAMVANMSQPQYGHTRETPMALIANGLLAYQGGADKAIDSMYSQPNKQLQYNTDQYLLNSFYGPQSNAAVSNAPPTLQGFYQNQPAPTQIGKNNNIGNLRDPKTGNFRTFNSPQDGLAAMEGDLNAKISGASKAMANAYGPQYTPTLRNLISVYAPPSENNTDNYIKSVSAATGIDPDRPLTSADVPAVTAAMARQENGPKAGQFAQTQLNPNAQAIQAGMQQADARMSQGGQAPVSVASNGTPSAQEITANGTPSAPMDARVDPAAGNKIYDYQGQKWAISPQGEVLNARDNSGTSAYGDPERANQFYDLGMRMLVAGRPGADALLQMGQMYDPRMVMGGMGMKTLPAPAQMAILEKAARARGDSDFADKLNMYAHIAPPGFQYDANGNMNPIPGYIAGKQAEKAGEASGTKAGESGVEVENQINDDADHALTQKILLNEMGQLAQGFKQGNLAPLKQKLGEWAIAAGMDPKDVNDKLGDVGDMQAMGKLTAQLATQSMKAFTSRGSQMEFKTFLANNPNAALTPEGFQKVLGFMTQMADNQINKQTEFQNWKQGKTPDQYLEFSPYWNSKLNATQGANNPPQPPAQSAPVQGARQAPDGNWYVPDPNRPGKYLMVK